MMLVTTGKGLVSRSSFKITYVFCTRYTYSLVFAADMYGKINISETSISNESDLYFPPCLATVFKADPLDPARGKIYRDKILLPGGSRDEVDILKVRLLTSL